LKKYLHYLLQVKDYLEVRQMDNAAKSLQKALEIFKILGIKGLHLAETYESLGMLWYHKGDYLQALQYYQKGLKITAPSMKSGRLDNNPNLEQIESVLSALRLLKSKSNCLKELYFINKNIENRYHTTI